MSKQTTNARRVKVICDSTCDLPQDQVEKYNLDVLPLYINLGDQSLKDRTQITPEDVYKWSEAHNKVPTTSCPTQQDCMEAIAPYIEQNFDVVVVTISSGMSSTYDRVASVAAQFPEGRVRVIDSRFTTAGTGLIAIEAAEMAQRGMTADEIENFVRPITKKAEVAVVFATVKYLYYGGRCSAVAAIGASVLGIRQVIGIEKGVVVAREKLRGKMSRVMAKYCEMLKPRLLNADIKRIFIATTGHAEEGLVAYLVDFLRSLGVFEEIIEYKVGCVVCAHVGPGAVGFVFRDK